MLPPIKIRLVDREHDMSLHNQTPIRIKIKEIKKNNTSSLEMPIKIKICDRDADMGSSYEKRKVKVREKSGKILIKYKEDVLETDEILEYLSNDYIKPIRIRLSTIDLVYTWLYELFLKFNFSAIIKQQMAIVAMNGKFVSKIIFSGNIFDTIIDQSGRPRFVLVFKHTIEKALDIFKVDGLRSMINFKQNVTGLSVVTEKNIYSKLAFDMPAISETIIYDIYPRTIEDITYTQDALGGSHTIEDEIGDGRTVYDILYRRVPRKE